MSSSGSTRESRAGARFRWMVGSSPTITPQRARAVRPGHRSCDLRTFKELEGAGRRAPTLLFIQNAGCPASPCGTSRRTAPRVTLRCRSRGAPSQGDARLAQGPSSRRGGRTGPVALRSKAPGRHIRTAGLGEAGSAGRTARAETRSVRRLQTPPSDARLSGPKPGTLRAGRRLPSANQARCTGGPSPEESCGRV